MFQSSPSREAGRYAANRVGKTEGVGFNPRPAVRPGATYDNGIVAGAFGVSILAQP